MSCPPTAHTSSSDTATTACSSLFPFPKLGLMLVHHSDPDAHVIVGIGVLVNVRVGVGVIVGVLVSVGVRVAVGVLVGVEMSVCVGVELGLMVGVDVDVLRVEPTLSRAGPQLLLLSRL